MSENDIIAEYVKEKRPEIIKSMDFVLYKIGATWRGACKTFKDAWENIDFSALKKAADTVNKTQQTVFVNAAPEHCRTVEEILHRYICKDCSDCPCCDNSLKEECEYYQEHYKWMTGGSSQGGKA